jgi:hypothetical protein
MGVKDCVDLKFKRLVEAWLLGFCCGVLVCVAITFFNNGIR